MNADLTLSGDSSLSRKHCKINIEERERCQFETSTRTGLWLVDLKSKYGTFVQDGENWLKLPPDTVKPLVDGDVVRFGIISNVWRVEYKPLLIVFSLLPSSIRSEVTKRINNLGGDVVGYCDPKCDLVITNSISLTLKILLALIYGIPIVRTSYLDKLEDAISHHQTFPPTKPHLPSVSEPNVRVDTNFDIQKRLTLFCGLTFFVGSAEQRDSLKTVVEAAGGKMELINSVPRSVLVQDGAVVVGPSQARASQSQSQSSQWDTDITEYLERHGRRSIPERELPLSIVYNSVDKLCNTNCQLIQLAAVDRRVVSSTIIQDNTEKASEPASSVRRCVQESQSQGNEHGTADSTPTDVNTAATSSLNVNTAATSSLNTSATASLPLAVKRQPSVRLMTPSIEKEIKEAEPCVVEETTRKRVLSPDMFDMFGDQRKRPRNVVGEPSTSKTGRAKEPEPGDLFWGDRRSHQTRRHQSQVDSEDSGPVGKRRGEDMVNIGSKRLRRCSEEDTDDSQPFKTPLPPMGNSRANPRLPTQRRVESTSPVSRTREDNVIPPGRRVESTPVSKARGNTHLSPFSVDCTPIAKVNPPAKHGEPTPLPVTNARSLSVLCGKHPNAGEDGFIDMSFKKDGSVVEMSALTAKVILCSLLSPTKTVVAVPGSGIANVKTFRKQCVVDPSRTPTVLDALH